MLGSSAGSSDADHTAFLFIRRREHAALELFSMRNACKLREHRLALVTLREFVFGLSQLEHA